MIARGSIITYYPCNKIVSQKTDYSYVEHRVSLLFFFSLEIFRYDDFLFLSSETISETVHYSRVPLNMTL